MDYAKELDVAMLAAMEAGKYLKEAYAAFVPIPDAPVSISTEADRTSQEIILARLSQSFPLDGLCAEEGTASLATSPVNAPRTWVVDPIDGTRGFAKKNGEFSVMIGLVVGGRVVVGVVLEPAIDRVTYAQFGHGCWSRTGNSMPRRCYVTQTAALEGSVLVQSHAKPGEPTVPQVVMKPGRVVETYSAGVKMAMVARGEVDIYANTYANFADWDICAGDLLVTEAGGTCSQLNGSPIAYGAEKYAQLGGLLASNGLVHAAAVAAMQAK